MDTKGEEYHIHGLDSQLESCDECKVLLSQSGAVRNRLHQGVKKVRFAEHLNQYIPHSLAAADEKTKGTPLSSTEKLSGKQKEGKSQSDLGSIIKLSPSGHKGGQSGICKAASKPRTFEEGESLHLHEDNESVITENGSAIERLSFDNLPVPRHKESNDSMTVEKGSDDESTYGFRYSYSHSGRGVPRKSSAEERPADQQTAIPRRMRMIDPPMLQPRRASQQQVIEKPQVSRRDSTESLIVETGFNSKATAAKRNELSS